MKIPLRQARDAARAMVDKHRLRAYDAIQFGSAIALLNLVRPIQDPVIVVVFDDELRDAAAAEGFPLSPLNPMPFRKSRR